MTPLFRLSNKHSLALLYEDAWEAVYNNPALAERLQNGCVLELAPMEMARNLSIKSNLRETKSLFAVFHCGARSLKLEKISYLDQAQNWITAPKSLGDIWIGDSIVWRDFESKRQRIGMLSEMPVAHNGSLTAKVFVMEDVVGFKDEITLSIDNDCVNFERYAESWLIGGPTPDEGEFPTLTEEERGQLTDLIASHECDLDLRDRDIASQKDEMDALEANQHTLGVTEDEIEADLEAYHKLNAELDEMMEERDFIAKKKDSVLDLDVLDKCTLMLNDKDVPSWRWAAARWICHCAATRLEAKLGEMGLNDKVRSRLTPYYSFTPQKLIRADFMGQAHDFIKRRHPDCSWREMQGTFLDLLTHPHKEPEAVVDESLRKQRLGRLVGAGYQALAALQRGSSMMPEIWQSAVNGELSNKLLTRAETDAAVQAVFLAFERERNRLKEAAIHSSLAKKAIRETSLIPERHKYRADTEIPAITTKR